MHVKGGAWLCGGRMQAGGTHPTWMLSCLKTVSPTCHTIYSYVGAIYFEQKPAKIQDKDKYIIGSVDSPSVSIVRIKKFTINLNFTINTFKKTEVKVFLLSLDFGFCISPSAFRCFHRWASGFAGCFEMRHSRSRKDVSLHLLQILLSFLFPSASAPKIYNADFITICNDKCDFDQ